MEQIVTCDSVPQKYLASRNLQTEVHTFPKSHYLCIFNMWYCDGYGTSLGKALESNQKDRFILLLTIEDKVCKMIKSLCTYEFTFSNSQTNIPQHGQVVIRQTFIYQMLKWESSLYLFSNSRSLYLSYYFLPVQFSPLMTFNHFIFVWSSTFVCLYFGWQSQA